jgi:hypothetical protein
MHKFNKKCENFDLKQTIQDVNEMMKFKADLK